MYSTQPRKLAELLGTSSLMTPPSIVARGARLRPLGQLGDGGNGLSAVLGHQAPSCALRAWKPLLLLPGRLSGLYLSDSSTD